MAAKRYQDLIVWQAAEEVRYEVIRLTNAGAVTRDFRFRDQLRAAAGSVSANITEGFRRYGSREFARFLGYAFASAGETTQWLDDGVTRGYWTELEIQPIRIQLRRLDAGLRSLMRYLRTPEAATKSRQAR